MRLLSRVFPFYRPELSRVVTALVLLAAAIGAGLARPWPLALAVDYVLNDRSLPAWLTRLGEERTAAEWVVILALGLFVIHAAQAALSAGHERLAIQSGLRGLERVRRVLFDQLQQMSPRGLQTQRMGDVLYRATWDVYAFQTLFQHGVFKSFQAVATLGLMVAVMVQVDAVLTGLALLLVPLLVTVMRAFGGRMNERSMSAHRADSQVTSRVQQMLAALPVIQSFVREPEESACFHALAAEARHRRAMQHEWEVAYLAVVMMVFAAGVGTLLWLGGWRVISGQLTVGGLLVFLAYLAQFQEPLNQISHMGATFSDAYAGVRRVCELMDGAETIQEHPQAREVILAGVRRGSSDAGGIATPGAGAVRVTGRLAYAEVDYGYLEGRLALTGVNLEVPAGKVLAVIGPSGAGKSTLLHLAMRFVDPSAGRVTLEGVDLRELRVADLRRAVAWVPQEPLLLPGTLVENIAFGKPDASREAVAAAAVLAQADDFIRRLPSGYDTRVGDGESRLSVGEVQRLALARAYLKDAPIVLLDEPTSALDVETEAAVLAGLRQFAQGRTVVITTHRRALLQWASRVCVVEAGRVTAAGTHEEIVRSSPFYARLLETTPAS